jgi:hypothetical protein
MSDTLGHAPFEKNICLQSVRPTVCLFYSDPGYRQTTYRPLPSFPNRCRHKANHALELNSRRNCTPAWQCCMRCSPGQAFTRYLECIPVNVSNFYFHEISYALIVLFGVFCRTKPSHLQLRDLQYNLYIGPCKDVDAARIMLII